MRYRSLRVLIVAVLVLMVAVAACGDDGASDGNGSGDESTPTATDGDGDLTPPDGDGEATPTETDDGNGENGGGTNELAACELIETGELEVLYDNVFSQEEAPPDEFASCFTFVNGGSVVLEVCDGCLSDDEFDQEVENAARGRGTASEQVVGVGDVAAWIPAGENDPNNGILWVKSGDVTLNLWLNVTTYRSEAAAQDDTVMLMEGIIPRLQ